MAISIKQVALKTIELEAQSVSGLALFINDDFEKAVKAIADCRGRVVVSGNGKSAVIAQKIVATLKSTGTHSIFTHAADAIHGDLGMVQQDDVVIIISKSGESPEIKVLVPLIKNFGNILIGMVGNTESYLAKNSSILLNTTVEQEACPNNLAPTSSTTAQLVMGDALAVCLMELKGFQSDDFAKFHPGGMLGKKLYLRVSDLCANNEKPKVMAGQSLKEVIVEMTEKRFVVTAVVDKGNKHVYVRITAGGIGIGFWPMSRTDFANQFLDILGTGKTLIQKTFDRYRRLVPVENIFVVTAKEYAGIVQKQLPELKQENILAEPSRKNTAPCIAYMAFKLIQ